MFWARLYKKLVFDDEQDAIIHANSNKFSFSARVMTSDLARAHRVVDALVLGNVWVKGLRISLPDLPFDAVKKSNVGRKNSLNTLGT